MRYYYYAFIQENGRSTVKYGLSNPVHLVIRVLRRAFVLHFFEDVVNNNRIVIELVGKRGIV